jgi:hypothetical protein
VLQLIPPKLATNIDQCHARILLEENPGGGDRFFRNVGFLEIDSKPGGGRVLGDDSLLEIGPNPGGGGGGNFFDTEKPRAVVDGGGASVSRRKG